MKKIVKIVGAMAIALALFTNLNTNTETTEADVLAFNVAEAMMYAAATNCRDTGTDTDYCYINGGFKFGCANNDDKNDCGGSAAIEAIN